MAYVLSLTLSVFLACLLPCFAAWAQDAAPDTSGNPFAQAATTSAKGSVEGGMNVTEVDPLFEIVIQPGFEARTAMHIVEPTNIGDGDDSTGVASEVAEILRRDFEMSGLFDVTAASTYRALVDLKRDGFTTSTIDFEAWDTVADSSVLVKGTYRVDGAQVELDLKLFDVTAGTEFKLDWSPSITRTARVRDVVHDFVNAVIEVYTGEKGVFGTRIIFSGSDSGNDRKIYSIENDGYGLTNYELPAGINVLPTWGPGGSVIFTSLRDDGDHVYSVKDGEMTQLTNDEGWSSGADYCSGANLVALTLATEESPEIFTMRPDGTELTQITFDTESIETSPSWSPGCKKVAFVSNRSGYPQIYTMSVDGSDVKRVTWLGNYNTTPEWSPKGDLIAFTARDERRRFDIFTVDANSSEIRRLTQDQGNNEEPSWAPDGNYLTFQSTRDGRQPRLYMMDDTGRWQFRIADSPGFQTPVWQR